MKFRSFFPYLGILTFLCAGCLFANRISPSEEMVEYKVPLDDPITDIRVSGIYNVKIINGDKEDVEVECNANLKPYLDIHQKGSTLYLEMDDVSGSNLTANVRIVTKNLSNISCSGATLTEISPCPYPDLNIDISGASHLIAEKLQSNHLKIEASGAPDMTLEGHTKTLNLESSGASKINGKDLTISEKTKLNASGTSHLSLKPYGQLKVKLSGASQMTSYGKPESVKKSISGVAKMKVK